MGETHHDSGSHLARKHKNRVATICNEEETMFEGEKVPEQFVAHFKKFLGCSAPVQPLDTSNLQVRSIVSNEDACDMIGPVSNEEIKEALFGIEDNKAPGPDGYTSKFFKKAWTVVGDDVCMAIKEFFATGKLLGEMDNDLCAAFSINVNGERPGYFKGGRGLRQGDPISPYLFTLVMEMFNIIVQSKIKDSPKFKYHWGCKQMKISHLCFADDLLMFCHGDTESVKVIKSALEDFSKVSGLVSNMGKSTMFFGNVKEHVKQEILSILPFKVGTLPVTFPLVSKQIGLNECKCLMEKVRVKVHCWKNKMLTYAGRLQLISSVLSSIHVYWAFVFILPKMIVKEIDKLLKGFLWCQ
ncbi:RNA-directed DNA polymerase, eukaryota, reverse transcriptase zinc-binding domain protein [Tanacetum coccineum]